MDRNNAAKLKRIFGSAKPLVGNVHLLPLPGSPRYRGQTVGSIIDRAVEDARAYADGGMDAVLVENHGDIPFLRPQDIGPETAAHMAVIATEVRKATGLPMGINVLANAPAVALAVAKASGAAFVRVNQWANAYVANEGLIEGDSARILRYRRSIDADHVAILADVHVKHGAHAIVGDRDVSEQARDVEFFDADIAIATGNRTGDTVPLDEIEAIRAGTTLPVIAGSGMTADNAAGLFAHLDGAIVGSSLKEGGHWANRVDRARVEALVASVASCDGRAGESAGERP